MRKRAVFVDDLLWTWAVQQAARYGVSTSAYIRLLIIRNAGELKPTGSHTNENLTNFDVTSTY